MLSSQWRSLRKLPAVIGSSVSYALAAVYARRMFRDLDPIRWRQLDHNPIALLREFTPERLAESLRECDRHGSLEQLASDSLVARCELAM